MTDSSDDSGAPAIPSWQRSTETSEPSDDKLEVARRFLDDEAVRDAPREKKVEFLKEKGIADSEIVQLLGKGEASMSTGKTEETEQPTISPPVDTSSDVPVEITPTSPSPTTTANSVSSSEPTTPASTTSPSLPHADRPPIVTYPEFLTKPTRPPPLVTTTGLLNTLYAFAGVSTLLYGASRYVVAPMLETQTEARYDLHAAAAAKLDAIVAKLEATVSEIPATAKHAGDDDSEADDPSEMFHRDMGTQTSPLLTPAPGAKASEPAAKKQADQLDTLREKLGDLRDGIRAQSEDMEDIKAVVDVFRDELDSLTYSGQNDYLSGYDLYGRSRKAEPEDEIKKAKDNIRRVKGVLLSTRNFPSSTR